ncbi:peptidoglycan-binding domain-containing protein [Acidiferrobacter sp.]|uniref:peptidoglycan-binding domain-containing protein n=1 Tax=Acidiferrobacter sp. TaxID=1872107 RepID=UPI002630371E|nr:peptidoglycan-binding domain-containing protein [Acidiferrobacter sp.]
MNTSVRKGLLGAAALFLSVSVAIPGAASAGMKMAAHKAVGSARVKAIQAALDKAGAHLKVDGFAGRQTSAALRAYQKKHHLKVTGTADAATLKSLKVK